MNFKYILENYDQLNEAGSFSDLLGLIDMVSPDKKKDAINQTDADRQKQVDNVNNSSYKSAEIDNYTPSKGVFYPNTSEKEKQFRNTIIYWATQFNGVEELTENKTFRVPSNTKLDEINASDIGRFMTTWMGWTPGEPYCAAWACAVVAATMKGMLNIEHKSSKVKLSKLSAALQSGNSQNFITSGKPQPGDLMVWTDSSGSNGHTEIFLYEENGKAVAMGANGKGRINGKSCQGIFLKNRDMKIGAEISNGRKMRGFLKYDPSLFIDPSKVTT